MLTVQEIELAILTEANKRDLFVENFHEIYDGYMMGDLFSENGLAKGIIVALRMLNGIWNVEFQMIHPKRTIVI